MKNLRLLVAMVSMSAIGSTAARFAVLVSAAQDGASPAMVGLLATLHAGAAAIFSVPAGRLIDRIGTKRPLLAGGVLLALSASLGAVLRSLPMLVAIMVLLGIAFNVLIIAFQRLAGDLAPPDRRAEAFGMLGFGFSISLLAGPLVSGFAIDLVGFTASFILFALFPFGAFVMVWTDCLPWSAPGATNGRPAPVTKDGAIAEPPRSGTLGLLRLPALRRLWVCCAAFEAAWMGFTFMLPIVGTQMGLNASRIGLIAGSAGFTLFLARASLTQLLRRFTPWQLLIIGLALGSVGFVGLALAGGFLWMAVFAGLIGMGQGACSPMLNALTYENAPDHEKGEAMAMRAMISGASQGTAPLVAGYLGSMLGVTPVFLLLAAGMAVTSWSARAQWQVRRRSAA
jgi:MFS family permease